MLALHTDYVGAGRNTLESKYTYKVEVCKLDSPLGSGATEQASSSNRRRRTLMACTHGFSAHSFYLRDGNFTSGERQNKP